MSWRYTWGVYVMNWRCFRDIIEKFMRIIEKKFVTLQPIYIFNKYAGYQKHCDYCAR